MQPKRPSILYTWLSISCFLLSGLLYLFVAHQWYLATTQYCYPYSYYFFHMSQMFDSLRLLVHSLSQVHLLNSVPVKVYDRDCICFSEGTSLDSKWFSSKPHLTTCSSRPLLGQPSFSGSRCETEVGLQDICCGGWGTRGDTFLRKRKQRKKCDVGLTEFPVTPGPGRVAMNLPFRVVHFWAKIARPLDPFL